MNIREALLWFVLVALVVVIGWMWASPVRRPGSERVDFSAFMSRVDAGSVARVTITGQDAIVTTKDKTTFTTRLPRDVNLTDSLVAKGVSVGVAAPSHSPAVELLLLYTSTVLPWFALLLAGLAWQRIRTLERRLAALRGEDER